MNCSRVLLSLGLIIGFLPSQNLSAAEGKLVRPVCAPNNQVRLSGTLHMLSDHQGGEDYIFLARNEHEYVLITDDDSLKRAMNDLIGEEVTVEGCPRGDDFDLVSVRSRNR